MAIIKCPECGHQISDKAPVCPNCGIEIAGKIITCPNCGETYFNSEGSCPHCHNAAPAGNMEQTPGLTPPDNEDKKKNNKTVYIASVVIAIAIIGACAYFYTSAQNGKEQDEYEYAMRSDDPTILQTYLANYKDAPQEHIDSINAHLQILIQQDQEWIDALVSGSKAALNEYLDKHPDSPHRQEALSKIDSIDWALCVKANTSDAYQEYLDLHSDGSHYEEAVLALEKIKSNEVSSDERLAISGIFNNFFYCINSKNESGLTANIGEHVNFLGKQDASKADVVSFLHKLYKADVESMVWSVPGNFDIQKKEIGTEQYEYDTTFMAELKLKKTDGSEATNQYRINAKVDPDGKIIEFAMTKIVE